jgi:hypothetical protein
MQHFDALAVMAARIAQECEPGAWTPAPVLPPRARPPAGTAAERAVTSTPGGSAAASAPGAPAASSPAAARPAA